MTWRTVAKGVFVGILAINLADAIRKEIIAQVRFNREMKYLGDYIENYRDFWKEMYTVKGDER